MEQVALATPHCRKPNFLTLPNQGTNQENLKCKTKLAAQRAYRLKNAHVHRLVVSMILVNLHVLVNNLFNSLNFIGTNGMYLVTIFKFYVANNK